jgi:hypothetical protein
MLDVDAGFGNRRLEDLMWDNESSRGCERIALLNTSRDLCVLP